MTETADVIIIGAGVQGASLAFHLAERGADVVVLERESIASGATGRSSGFVRMHYDLRSDAELAWASFPYFEDWAGRVGSGDCGFVRTGFLHIVAADHAEALRANVETHQKLGIDTGVVDARTVADLVPGIVTDDVTVAAYEPRSGYADPSSTTAGFLAAARERGARFVQHRRAIAVREESGRISGVEAETGGYAAPVVVDVAGAWAAEIAASVGLEVPVQAWRHDTAFFSLPDGHGPGFPVVIDDPNGIYFRPEGRGLMLVGLEDGNVVGGSPDRPLTVRGASVEEMAERVCRRVPWMAGGRFQTAHGGQDGITPDQRAIIGPAGPDGFFLACGFSGTGFKTAPAIGRSLAEWIIDGSPSTVDLRPYALERFAAGRPLTGEHPYGALWR